MTNAPAIAGNSFRSFPAFAAVDPTRIAAESGALAIHVVAIMLLLVPIAAPMVMAPAREITVVPIDVPRITPRPVDPVPVRIERETPPRTSLPTPHPPRIERLPDYSTSALDIPADAIDAPSSGPHDSTASAETAVAADPPGIGAQLQHLSAPPPVYPRAALRDGLTGTVMLEVVVDVDGRPLEVRIARSSGHRELDQAARRQVLTRWRFRPALLDGQPVQAVGRVPVDFSLD